jgi:hypothetical protein
VKRALAAALLAGAAGSALAQDIQIAPSAALQCMTPPAHERGEPKYPEAALRDGRGAELEIELEFRGPRSRPRLKVLDGVGGPFLEALEEHVSGLRVPCMPDDGPPVRLHQRYVFNPAAQDRVSWSSPVDEAQAGRSALLACMRHVRPGSLPVYPIGAERAGFVGRVVAELTFTSADGPPEIRLQPERANGSLLASAEAWAQGWRLPCWDGVRTRVLQTFVYSMEGEAQSGFLDLTLMQLLGNVKGIGSQRLRFDFRTMGCPFEVQLQYLQPHWRNRLGVRGPEVLARAPFLEWLAGIELALPGRSLRAVYGATAKFEVPCALLDLDPQRKGTAAGAAPASPQSAPEPQKERP